MGINRNKKSPQPDTASSLPSTEPFYSRTGLSAKFSKTQKKKRASLVADREILLENLWEQPMEIVETMCRHKTKYNTFLTALQRNGHTMNPKEHQTAHQYITELSSKYDNYYSKLINTVKVMEDTVAMIFHKDAES